MYFSYILYSFALALLMLLVFGILQWFNVPAGSFLDWIIGTATFGWLLVIVTVPWNIHFEAKTAIAEAAQSAEKGIAVDSKQVGYARAIAQKAFWAAIALHLVSAISLYWLAAAGISIVGYVGSGAALLLTILRPAVRAYEYLAARLAALRQEFKYPREDVVELRRRFEALEVALDRLDRQINPEEPNSWTAAQRRQLEAIRSDLTRLSASFEDARATNQAEHDRLGREAREAIAQLSADSQFLDRVREIIRFFKSA